MLKVKRLLSGVRWYAVNMAHWLRQRRKRIVGDGPEVWIDVQENLWHRYLHILILFFNIRGYTVHIRHRWGFIASWASNDLFRRSARFVLYTRGSRVPNDAWLFTDKVMARPHVLLTADYYRLPGEAPNGFALPMPLVDTQYITGSYDRTSIDLDAARQRGVFFFGNMDPVAYSKPEIAAVFGCFHRARTLALVRAHFQLYIHEPHKLDETHVHGDRYIVLSGRQHQYLQPTELLSVLARFDLFLAPSGVSMPLCHNLVEALCAGCIPILQHAHLMEPPLQDGVDCFTFRTEEDLVRILKEVPTMDPAKILSMRKNVLSYYRHHLTPEAVIGKLEKERPVLKLLRMNAELTSTHVLRSKLDAAGIGGPLPFLSDGKGYPVGW